MIPTAAIAVRTTAEAAARDLAKVEVAGLGNSNYGIPQSASGDNTEAMLTRAVNIPGLREKVESYFFENNRCVSRIDPDLAVLRSFSLNAKIAFQRQRNVAADMERQAMGGWGAWSQRLTKLLGVT